MNVGDKGTIKPEAWQGIQVDGKDADYSGTWVITAMPSGFPYQALDVERIDATESNKATGSHRWCGLPSSEFIVNQT